MRARRWAAPAWALLIYVIVTAVLGRAVLSNPGNTIAHDPGDPLLTAAILHWNAHHVPFTEAWWQFPIFHPTRDTLTFSEHLLGVSVIASPIAWLAGNPLTAYNLALLLTFPLAAMAMYALVHRLTGSAAAAFLAGLAFGFAPYRMSTLAHIQMLTSFWAPLALLGLHAYIAPETPPRRRFWWLALFGAAWALQGAANGYALVFFSVLVGLWVVWFVVARRNWPALGGIAAATALASLPLAPILYRYVTVHAFHGFERSLDEMRAYSADVAAVLCAPTTLTFWGWVRVACRGEGELFPGVALFAVFAAATFLTLRRGRSSGRPLTILRGVLLGVAAVYALIVASVLVMGPWQLDVAFVHVSASDIDKPFLIALAAGAAALLLTLVAHHPAGEGSTIRFYLFAAVATWLLALGPTLTFMGESSGRPGPFTVLQVLPGVGSLRVPARFWLMTVMCLAVAAGLFFARIRRRGRLPAPLLVAVACALLADGWIAKIPAPPPPPAPPDVRALQGGVALQLPINPFPDIAATWHAVTGGWRTVNGYSGYAPNYYEALRLASQRGDEALFPPFRRDHDLHVVVTGDDAAISEAVERQPGAQLVARRGQALQYRLPRRDAAAAARPGEAIRIENVHADCARDRLARVADADPRSIWDCTEPEALQVLTIDLGQVSPVSAVVYHLGPQVWAVPAQMAVETSLDGVTWSGARRGSVLREFIEGGLAQPKGLRAVLPFAPREARYVRLRPIDQQAEFVWVVAEIQVLAPFQRP